MHAVPISINSANALLRAEGYDSTFYKLRKAVTDGRVPATCYIDDHNGKVKLLAHALFTVIPAAAGLTKIATDALDATVAAGAGEGAK